MKTWRIEYKDETSPLRQAQAQQAIILRYRLKPEEDPNKQTTRMKKR